MKLGFSLCIMAGGKCDKCRDYRYQRGDHFSQHHAGHRKGYCQRFSLGDHNIGHEPHGDDTDDLLRQL